MRMLRIAATAATLLALICPPAQAQMGGSGVKHRDILRPEKKKPLYDEKAYKAALERIPEPKEKYDPWGVARPAEPDKTKPK
jgi:hypothetical protein